MSQATQELSGIREDNTKYVLSGQATGWSAMAQVARDFDQEKVQECKEDIDTLLVFAGLFSAVLSAFLLATYPNLQEDPSDMLLQVLERIAVQTSSYNFNSNTLNSTLSPAASPSAFPPFEPSVDDIRVNVLWFASLILSLITASFGILVKQWLREYMAVENPSPQARLRVRHVRYPELKKWKIIEIAAILPLLLQIALGLFFVGLCYLTASIHRSIASVTLPLVIGWAFCITAATLMPLLFPRCPLKTTFLKSVLRLTRKAMVLLTLNTVTLVVEAAVRVLRLSDDLRDWLQEKAVRPLSDACIDTADGDGYETLAVSTDTADIAILAAVDAIQSNDELLSTTILDTLLRIKPPLDAALRFVTKVLQHRLRDVNVSVESQFPLFNDMALLSYEARAAIVNILCPSMNVPLISDTVPIVRTAAYISAFGILLSALSVDAHLHALDVVRTGIMLDGPYLISAIAKMCFAVDCADVEKQGRDRVGFLFQVLTVVSTRLQLPFNEALQCFEAIWGVVLTQRNQFATATATSSSPLLCQNLRSDVMRRSSTFVLRYSSARYLTETIKHEFYRVRTTESTSLAPRIHDGLTCWSRIGDETSGSYEDIWVELFLYTSLHSGRTLVDTMLVMELEWVDDRRHARHAIQKAIQQLLTRGDIRIWDSLLDNIYNTIADGNSTHGELPAFMPSQLLKLCLVLIWMAVLPESIEYKPRWTRLFDTIVVQIRACPETSTSDKTWATRCLSEIEAAEHQSSGCTVPLGLDAARLFWFEWFSPQKTVFSDDMVEGLACVCPHDYADRRRRWNEMSSKTVSGLVTPHTDLDNLGHIRDKDEESLDTDRTSGPKGCV